MKRFFPTIEYKIRYIFVFMAFFGSFELFGLLFSEQHEFFEIQLFGTLLFTLMQFVVFFQWSTILTAMASAAFLINFLILHIGHVSDVEEVCKNNLLCTPLCRFFFYSKLVFF